MSAAVPVLMYHSVGRVVPNWDWAYLTVPWRTFEEHLERLARARYRTVDLAQLHDHVSGRKPLTGKSVVLTFDDGYVDNWTYVYPLLKKHGFSATVVVTPEFVDTRDIVRPTLEDVWSKQASETSLESLGYMSWKELRRASDEGILSVQSHALTHTWYPTGPEIVDFHHPGDAHYWLDWNARPEKKPYYLESLGQSGVPWGVPVYEHAKSLEATRYFPDPAESQRLVSYVVSHCGRDFFTRSDWRDRLQEVVTQWRAHHPPTEHYEAGDERRQRLLTELEESKRIIESRLGKEVHSMFWPGGGYDDESLSLAQTVYRSVTISGKVRWRLSNTPGEDPAHISRRGVPFVDTDRWRAYTGGDYLVWFLNEQRGRLFARGFRQFQKLLYVLGARTGAWPRAGSIERIPLPRG